MTPPTVTAQEQKTGIRNGKPFRYDPPELKAAKQKLTAHLSRFKPDKPYCGGIRLVTKWLFPRGSHRDGEYRTTRPDTDNLQKMLKDCMTRVGFWKDDAQVCSEITEKFWAELPGLYVAIQEIGGSE
jgi:Holliday junction resolvase RusA-like endonuclease